MPSVEISNKRKPYEKPRIRVIELNADEVLVIGCKSNAQTAGGKRPGFNCFLPTPCSAQAS